MYWSRPCAYSDRVTVKITPFDVGGHGTAYFERGEGCGHAHQAQTTAEKGGIDYFAERGSRGRWWGPAVEYLGGVEGQEITESDFEAAFKYLADPAVLRQKMAEAESRIVAEGLKGKAAAEAREAAIDAARLGGKPYVYKTLDERIAARVAKEAVCPVTEPERLAKIELEEAAKKQPRARAFYDVTPALSKSNSLFYGGLLTAGRDADAARMQEIHRESVGEMLEYIQQQVGTVRVGHHGKAPAGRPSVGRWQDGAELVATVWEHQTNRESEPHMHAHALILSKVRTVDADGTVRWRALDSRGLHKARAGAAAVYERCFEERMEAEFGVAYQTRPDGKARELVGITEVERHLMSTRAVQTTETLTRWAAEYEVDHGHAPGELLLRAMHEEAARQTRAPKRTFATEAEMIGEWERMAGQRLKGTLGELVERAEAAGVRTRRTGNAVEFDREALITQAIDNVQARFESWSRSQLMFEIKTLLPDGVRFQDGHGTAQVLEDLTEQALSGPYEVLRVQGLEYVTTPRELCRADGTSIYQPKDPYLYATHKHMAAEQEVVARARATGGMVLRPEEIQQVKDAAVERGRPLSEDQAAVVDGVLGRGHHVDVVVGPAGAGKSTVQGAIAGAWKRCTGGRAIGLGPSAKSAEVLREQGIDLTMNTTRWVQAMDGKGNPNERETFRFRRGDLVVLDEAGFTETNHIVRVVRAAKNAGAKVVLCGDHGQMSAVGAGGLFQLLTQDAPALALETVRRFRNPDGTIREWEGQASLQLREGQLDAVRQYMDHGRVVGGTREESIGGAVRAFCADDLNGVQSVVLTTTTDDATEVAGEIRRELVRLERVEAEGVLLRDGNVAGARDIIQARNNAFALRDSAGAAVLNRYNYRVFRRGEDGSLTAARIVERKDGVETYGGFISLPPEYVADEITLAYASTVGAVQGDTVEGSYSLVDSSTAREAGYTMNTRGSGMNKMFVICEPNQDVAEVLAQIVTNSAAKLSATEQLREEHAWIESLPANAPKWADLVGEYSQQASERALRTALTPDEWNQLAAADASTVFRQLRAAELAGHDVPTLVAQAIGAGPVDDADNMAKLIHWRIERALEHRVPEGPAAGSSWVERTPARLQGPRGELARELAEAMDARQWVLGERLADAAPVWAVRQWGPVPDGAVDPVGRAEWEARAGVVERYRELYNVGDTPGTIIGAPPGTYMVEQYADWQAAQQALGRTPEERNLAEASDHQLREWVGAYEREKEWAPPAAAQPLADSEHARQWMTERAAYARREAEIATDPAERGRLWLQSVDYQNLADQMAADHAQWEQIYQAREAWWGETTAERERAQAATAELERRHADTAPEVDEPTRAEQPDTAEREPGQTPEPECAEPEPTAEAGRSADTNREAESVWDAEVEAVLDAETRDVREVGAGYAPGEEDVALDEVDWDAVHAGYRQELLDKRQALIVAEHRLQGELDGGDQQRIRDCQRIVRHLGWDVERLEQLLVPVQDNAARAEAPEPEQDLELEQAEAEEQQAEGRGEVLDQGQDQECEPDRAHASDRHQDQDVEQKQDHSVAEVAEVAEEAVAEPVEREAFAGLRVRAQDLERASQALERIARREADRAAEREQQMEAEVAEEAQRREQDRLAQEAAHAERAAGRERGPEIEIDGPPLEP